MSGLLLRNVELPGGRFDIRCAGGVVAEVAHDLVPVAGESVLVGATSVLPGLHDHHLHLMAMAARSGSVDLGDDGPVSDADLRSFLRRADAGATGNRWIRAVGYDGERGASPDRRVLDDAVPHRPVRVQHRSGHLWILNSAACRAVGLDRMDGTDRIERDDGIEGIERDGDGIPTGRLFDLDDWLASRLPRDAPPELGAVSRRLAGFGVTGVTDATPSRRAADLDALALGRSSGAVVQHLVVMGGSELAPGDAPDGLELGPVKVMVSDEHPPGIDDLAHAFAAAHGRGPRWPCTVSRGCPPSWPWPPGSGAAPTRVTGWSTAPFSPPTRSPPWPGSGSVWSPSRRSSPLGATATGPRSTPVTSPTYIGAGAWGQPVSPWGAVPMPRSGPRIRGRPCGPQSAGAHGPAPGSASTNVSPRAGPSTCSSPTRTAPAAPPEPLSPGPVPTSACSTAPSTRRRPISTTATWWRPWSPAGWRTNGRGRGGRPPQAAGRGPYRPCE